MVYPVAGREEEEAVSQDTAAADSSTSGKYEPLVHMNTILTSEIHRTMAEAASELLMYSIVEYFLEWAWLNAISDSSDFIE